MLPGIPCQASGLMAWPLSCCMILGYPKLMTCKKKKKKAIMVTRAMKRREGPCCIAPIMQHQILNVMLPLGEPNPEPVGWAEVPSVSGLAGLAEPSHALSGRAYQSPGH